jgi:hypothetical protein
MIKRIFIITLLFCSLFYIYSEGKDIDSLLKVKWDMNLSEVKKQLSGYEIIDLGDNIKVLNQSEYNKKWIFTYSFENNKLMHIYIHLGKMVDMNSNISIAFDFVEYLYSLFGQYQLSLCNIPFEVNYIWILPSAKISVRYSSFDQKNIGRKDLISSFADGSIPVICISKNE